MIDRSIAKKSYNPKNDKIEFTNDCFIYTNDRFKIVTLNYFKNLLV